MLTDFFTVSVRRQDDGVVGIVVRRDEVDMAVAVAVSHGPADSHVMAVVAFLLALIFGHTVIVLLDDLWGRFWRCVVSKDTLHVSA